MKKLLLLALIICSFILPDRIQGQEYLSSVEFTKFWRNLDHLKSLEAEESVNYKGSPYLFESENAVLTINDNQLIEGLTLRYNVYNDRMEIKKDELFYNVPREKFIKSIMLDQHLFKLQVYQAGNKKKTAYLEVLVEDSLCSLFLKYNVNLNEAEEPKPYQEAKLAEFKKAQPDLFVSFNRDILKQIDNKKEFLELAPEHKNQLTNFIKKNKTKFKKPESVKQLVEYYNTL